MDNPAKISDIKVKIPGNTAFFAMEKSPTLAWVRNTNKNEVMMAAFEDFMARPTKSAIKLILTITTDLAKSCR